MFLITEAAYTVWERLDEAVCESVVGEGLKVVAVGWRLWVSLKLNDVLFKLEFILVAVGWQVWILLIMSGELGGDVTSVGAVGWLVWVSCVGWFAGGWLLESELRSVAACR